jgi:hypothetical protein
MTKYVEYSIIQACYNEKLMRSLVDKVTVHAEIMEIEFLTC